MALSLVVSNWYYNKAKTGNLFDIEKYLNNYYNGKYYKEVQELEEILHEKAFQNTLAIPFHFYLQPSFLLFFDLRESFHALAD